ncbi:MAG TPA: hypothetical protein VJO15_00720 [Dehalococcoidia bacterium]|nr:hypothetical protein [Dehalococcoidia bacterium]
METVEDLLPYARHIVTGPSVRRTYPAGYGVKAGERVLVAVDSFYDRLVVDAFLRAIREAGAQCDLYVADNGPDREADELDEMRVFMGNTPWGKRPLEPPPWFKKVEAFAEAMGYDLLVRGIGGPTQNTPYRNEGIPWISREILASGATTFPYELWDFLQVKAWEPFWKNARGGRVRVTDPEGTDFTFTMQAHHIDDPNPRLAFQPRPFHGHMMGHPPPPYDDAKDGDGVAAGCINHFGRPFPRIKVYLERGQVRAVEGGGKYGDGWRQLLEMTRNTKYPEFPRPGLFWLWEIAIGTNPKFIRPRHMMSRARGAAYERLRSGIIHVGLGTRILSYSEEWAAGEDVPYGHLHVHLQFPTLELTSASGEKYRMIDHGRLTSLDDPEVVSMAEKYGDPEELLKEDWIPAIPGISIPGDYWKDYAGDPAGWIESREAAGLPT